jgi:hypothetical protein
MILILVWGERSFVRLAKVTPDRSDWAEVQTYGYWSGMDSMKLRLFS